MKLPLILILALAAAMPASAQLTLDPSGTPVQPATPAPAPSQQVVPSRSISPTGINHKPNPTQPPAEIAAAIDKFFKTIQSGDYTKGYDTFLGSSRMGTQTDKKSYFISKTQEALGIYGKLRDYEIFDNYSVGSNVMVLTYLSRHDTQPLRWRFIYYRPDKTWVITNMSVDDQLMDMLD